MINGSGNLQYQSLYIQHALAPMHALIHHGFGQGVQSYDHHLTSYHAHVVSLIPHHSFHNGAYCQAPQYGLVSHGMNAFLIYIPSYGVGSSLGAVQMFRCHAPSLGTYRLGSVPSVLMFRITL